MLEIALLALGLVLLERAAKECAGLMLDAMGGMPMPMPEGGMRRGMRGGRHQAKAPASMALSAAARPEGQRPAAQAGSAAHA